MIELDTAVADERWSVLGDVEALARRSVEAAFAVACSPLEAPVVIGLLLADDAAIRELNRAWRGQDKPTNVLSFPAPAQPSGGAGPRVLGDIALAYETVVREARQEAKVLADHVAHLLVHGTLHLLGRDHQGNEEADAMEALEIRALAGIGIANPYRDEAAGAAA